MASHWRRTAGETFVGGVVGGIIGAIIAVNVVLTAGIDDGYQASIPDIFRENVVVGVITVAIWIAGPVVGVIAARRFNRRRQTPNG